MPSEHAAARPPWLAYGALAASRALVGSYVGLSRLLVAVFPVFLLAWLRFGIAALAMAHWVHRTSDEARLSTHDRRLLFWESFLGNFLFSICMLFGVAWTSAVSAGVVMAAIPATVALLSRWWLGERISRRVIQRAEGCTPIVPCHGPNPSSGCAGSRSGSWGLKTGSRRPPGSTW